MLHGILKTGIKGIARGKYKMTKKKPTETQVKVKINTTVSILHLRKFIESIRCSAYYSFSDCPIVKQLEEILEEAEKKDQNSVLGKKLQQESLEKDGDEYISPEYYFFAVRHSDSTLFDVSDNDDPSFELHLCVKWDWYLNNQVYPIYDYCNYDFDLSAIGENEDADGSVSYWTGDIEEARKYLTKIGMEEKPSLLEDYDKRYKR